MALDSRFAAHALVNPNFVKYYNFRRASDLRRQGKPISPPSDTSSIAGELKEAINASLFFTRVGWKVVQKAPASPGAWMNLAGSLVDMVSPVPATGSIIRFLAKTDPKFREAWAEHGARLVDRMGQGPNLWMAAYAVAKVRQQRAQPPAATAAAVPQTMVVKATRMSGEQYGEPITLSQQRPSLGQRFSTAFVNWKARAAVRSMAARARAIELRQKFRRRADALR